MMGLRFDPIGGGQFKQAVQGIIEAESQPLKSLNARKTKEDSRMKLFQEFKGKFTGLEKLLSDLSDFRKFRELKADLGDGEDLASVTLDKDRAEPGRYTIEIDELAKRTALISNGLSDPDAPLLGTGFVMFYTEEGDAHEVYIDDSHSSLHGVSSLINRNSKSPFQASVIKDMSDSDAPWKFILTAKKDGEIHQLDYPDFYFSNANVDFYVDDDVESANAEVTIDGFPVELDSNDETDFLSGVNLHIKGANPDKPFILTISQDYQKIAGKVKAAIDQVNQILQFVTKQNAIDANSDTTTTFAGDSSLQSLEYRVRNVFHQGYIVQDEDTEDETVVYLSQIGIEFEKTGQISFKEEKFTTNLEKNFELLGNAISGPTGFVNKLRELLNGYTQTTTGILSSKEQSIRSRIREIDNQIDDKSRVLDQRKQALTDKFSRLEATLGNLQKQQQYLAAALPGAGGGNPISQLLGG
jgi:flagellar hook-associated protein 2